MDCSMPPPANPSDAGDECAPPPDARSVVASALAQLPEESLTKILKDLQTDIDTGISADDVGIEGTSEISSSAPSDEDEKEGETEERGGVRFFRHMKKCFDDRLTTIEKQVGDMKKVVGIQDPEDGGYEDGTVVSSSSHGGDIGLISEKNSFNVKSVEKIGDVKQVGIPESEVAKDESGTAGSSSRHRGGVRLLSQNNSVDDRLMSIEKQLEDMKQVVGIPEPEVSGFEKFRLALIGTVNNKLVLLGKRTAFAIAILVMLISIAWIIGFTVSMSRRCTKFAGLINGYHNEFANDNQSLPDMTLPPLLEGLIEGERAGTNIYQGIYGNENTHICSTEEQLSYAPEDGSAVRTIWKPCILDGFHCSDYEQEKSEYCSYLSCQRPCEIKQPDDDEGLFDGGLFDGGLFDGEIGWGKEDGMEELLNNITEEVNCVCNNQVRIIYYVCPDIAPLLGSAFGYLFLLQLLSLILLVGLHWLVTKKKQDGIKERGAIVAEQILPFE